MDLYLVRHAAAENRDPERWPDDSQRPLSADGIQRFRSVARGLERLGVEIEGVLASSYTRSWQTAELLAKEADWPPAERFPTLEPPSAASACVDELRSRKESSLALVGHQPQLSELASLLLTASEHSLRLDLKKGGIVSIRCADLAAVGMGLLRWSMSPRIARFLAR